MRELNPAEQSMADQVVEILKQPRRFTKNQLLNALGMAPGDAERKEIAFILNKLVEQGLVLELRDAAGFSYASKDYIPES